MSAVEEELAGGVKLGYRPELDGLRAFAVVAVVALHYWPERVPGGVLGVDLFFVLSGFLITRLLLEQVYRTGGVALGNFYVRRAARLLPAVCLVSAFVALDALTIRGTGTTKQSLEGIGVALAYATNWAIVFSHISPAFNHFWSLAVEEQFYLIWPVVLLLACRHGGLQSVRRVTIAVFVAASCEMIVRSFAGVGFATLIYSTDAHPCVMLMAGCFLATIASTSGTPAQPRWLATATRAAVPVAAVTVALALKVTPHDTLWILGVPLIAVGFALLINRALSADWLTGPLRARPVVWVGTLSYGIYVYHYPIHLFMQNEFPGQRQVTIGVVSIALTFAVASASYYLVERPARRSVITRFAKKPPARRPAAHETDS